MDTARRLRRRRRPHPRTHIRRIRAPGDGRHDALRPPGDGPERRSGLGRHPRPRVHRVLRLRRVSLRRAFIAALRAPLADLGLGSRRDRRHDRPRLLAGTPDAPAERRLPRDRDALLRSDVRDLRDAGLSLGLARLRRDPRHHRRPERAHAGRPLADLRARADQGARLHMGGGRRVPDRRARTRVRESLADGARMARRCATTASRPR